MHGDRLRREKAMMSAFTPSIYHARLLLPEAVLVRSRPINGQSRTCSRNVLGQLGQGEGSSGARRHRRSAVLCVSSDPLSYDEDVAPQIYATANA